MSVDFSSVCNHNEGAVFDAVLAGAHAYPGMAEQPDLVADVACVALNRLTPRYIRHTVDLVFYQTEAERKAIEEALAEAVDYAFDFVLARRAMRERA